MFIKCYTRLILKAIMVIGQAGADVIYETFSDGHVENFTVQYQNFSRQATAKELLDLADQLRRRMYVAA